MSDQVGIVAVNDLKQACLDLANAAGRLFDLFDEHELEAAWQPQGPATIVQMELAHEKLRSFLSLQATSRLRALGIAPEQYARGLEDDRSRRRR